MYIVAFHLSLPSEEFTVFMVLKIAGLSYKHLEMVARGAVVEEHK